MKLLVIILICLNFESFSQLTEKDLSNKGLKIIQNTDIIRSNEKRITNSIPPETDIDVAINPLDDNNLILTSIQHRLNNSEDSYLMPIFYSHDNGRNWARSNFRLLPKDEYRVILNASSPCIDFTQRGLAILSWSVTFLEQKFPGVDSIYHQLLFAYSLNGGESWQENFSNSLISESGIRDPAKPNQGSFVRYSDIQILSDTIKKEDYIFFNEFRYDKISNTKFHIYRLDGLFFRKYYTDSLITNEYVASTNYDCIIDSSGYLNCVFLSFNEKLNISLAKIDFQKGRLLLLNDVSEVNYTGGFYFPGAFSSNLIGLNGSYFAPTPKFILLENNYHIIWNSSGLESQLFNHNIYYTRTNNAGEVLTPKIINNNINGFQFNPDINFALDGRLYVSYYEINSPIDSSSANINITYSEDWGNSFYSPVQVNYKSSDYNNAGDRNFDYGVGLNSGLKSNSNQLFQFWTDGRTNDGNFEVYLTQLPLNQDLDTYVNEINKNIKIEGPSITNNTFTFVVTSKVQINSLVYISNQLGQKIIQTKYDRLLAGENYYDFNLSAYPSGIYYFVSTSPLGNFSIPFFNNK
ncbi:hypothetical protein OAQ99_04185 [Candidatus Kapabacteria bacterium]|nr:hypothetical protein [Candidatus Kapabacteria bacterium]